MKMLKVLIVGLILALPTPFSEIVAKTNPTEQIIQLQEKAVTYFQQEAYQKALDSAVEAFEITKQHYQESTPEYISSLYLLGSFLYNLGEYEQALPLYEAVQPLAQKIFGQENPETLMISYELSDMYYTTMQFDRALPLLQNTIPVLRKVLGETDEKTLASRLLQAQVQKNKGELKAALNNITSIVPLYRSNYPENATPRLQAEEALAEIQQKNGYFSKAEKNYRQLVEKRTRLFGANAPETLIARSSLAENLRQMGNYQEAATIFQSVIAKMEEVLGPDDPELYYTLGNLAALYEQQSQFKKAEQLFVKILDFDKKTLGEEHLNTIIDMNNLAGIYRKQGDYALAEEYFQKALDKIIAVVGPEHPESISIANNLALLYENQGLYDKAEPLLKEALKSANQTLGEKNPKTLAMMNNLALLYESQGVFKQSEPLYNKAIILNTEVFGPEHENTVASLNNLGYLYLIEKKYDKAAPRFKTVYKIWQKTFGDKNQKTLKALNNLGRVYHRQNRLQEAEEYISKALQLRKDLLGEEHPDTIRSLIDLSALYVSQNRLEKAENALQQTLKTAENALGKKHPYTFEALNNLADFYEAQNQIEKALEIRGTGFDRRTQFFERVLWASGENTRQAYITLHKPEQHKYLKLLAQKKDQNSAKAALYISLQRKGLILKIASEIHKIVQLSSSPELKAKAQALDQKRKELSAKTLSGPMSETIEEFQAQLVELENEINDLQAELSRASLSYQNTTQKIQLEDVFEKIEPDDILIDYITYKDGTTTKVMAVTAQKETESCYLFFDCTETKVNIVPIGTLKAVQDVVAYYRDTIQDEDAEEEDLLYAGKEAYSLIWEPLAKHIGKRTSIYVVPDSILHILPFDALIDENDNYLIQDLDIKILSSVRDIVIPPLPKATGDFLIFAGPDYDIENMKSKVQKVRRKRNATSRSIRISSHGLRSLSFEPLDGAELEGKTIQKVSEEEQTPSTILIQREAEENRLRNVSVPPNMLHIATHGFFLKAEERLKKRLLSVQRGGHLTTPPPGDNPLLRAGLAFAGINSNAPFLGDIDTDNDGVLTAMEVLGLKLSGTQLVVLSACETGVGEIHAGEGVYGLRRSFQEAGVTNVVNSLWPVSDEGTRFLMEIFYHNIYDGMPPRQALRASQRKMMSSMWNHPYFWSAFVMVTRKQP